jgi:hypothetical protein
MVARPLALFATSLGITEATVGDLASKCSDQSGSFPKLDVVTIRKLFRFFYRDVVIIRRDRRGLRNALNIRELVRSIGGHRTSMHPIKNPDDVKRRIGQVRGLRSDPPPTRCGLTM